MVKFVNNLATLGVASVNPDGRITTGTGPATSSAKFVALQSKLCPVTSHAISQKYDKFHQKNVCDHSRFNIDHFRQKLARHRSFTSLKESGAHVHIPNERTVTCPSVVHNLKESVNGHHRDHHKEIQGYDRTWIVENTASTAVVVSFVNENGGIEYSAMDPTISPPEADSKAILQPGAWHSFHTMEGHVFHVRELLPDGSAGKVLLQHLVGLVPVGDKVTRSLVCPDVDVEPKITVVNDQGVKEVITDPNFARAKDVEWNLHDHPKDCNLLEVGFRNMVQCPLHGYYVTPDSCDEVFKFHLGVGGQVDDFMRDWQSTSKWESTYMGHTFVFRSAFSDQVVDTITLQPTQIVDCPDLKQQTVASAIVSSTQAIAIPSTDQMRSNESNSSFSNSTIVSPAAIRPQFSTESLFYAAKDHGASF